MVPRAPSKRTRGEAVGRARALLDKRRDGNELWATVFRYTVPAGRSDSDERAKVLVLGAILEQGLESAILSHCVFDRSSPAFDAEQRKLFGGGPDGSVSFSVKTRLGYALGIYGSDTRDDLDIIRRIRNLFAHEKTIISFSDEVLIALCDELKWPAKYVWGGLAGPEPATAAERFDLTLQHFYAYLDGTDWDGKPIRYLDFPVPDMFS